MSAGAAASSSRRPPAALVDALVRMGLLERGEPARFRQLRGGVSSDIWRVDAAGAAMCVKRALPRLRVAAEWRAPLERNAYEVAWMRTVAGILPDAVPAILGEDRASGSFAMRYLDPARYPVWKEQLRLGQTPAAVARRVGERVGHIHAATAGDPQTAQRFATDAIFHALRLEPYLLATARAHPDRAGALEALAERTAAARHALVHGDVSPKNILMGPKGPVFLDAECAWYGDPAFDAAFCLNHLLLKCLWTPAAAPGFLACFDALAQAWCARVRWEPPEEAESRAASLLPGLMLGRVDGKSPVEYLTREAERERVRAFARALLARPVSRLDALRARWAQAVAA